MNLSNRTIWVLIILWFIIFWFWFYKYFFEIKLKTFVIESNRKDFSWKIENTKFKKDFFCWEKKCELENIPPFEYKIYIKKDGYKDYEAKINLAKVDIIKINLEKELKLETSNKPLKINIEENLLKKANKNLVFEEIYGKENYIYYKVKDNLYIKNLYNNNIFTTSFKPKIIYIKSLWEDSLWIVSDLWTFRFNLINKNIDYFSIFNDYVDVWDFYIWVIKNDDKKRKINHSFENINWDLIISYDKKTKKKSLIKSSKDTIEKIYLNSWKVYVTLKNGEYFEIKWY